MDDNGNDDNNDDYDDDDDDDEVVFLRLWGDGIFPEQYGETNGLFLRVAFLQNSYRTFGKYSTWLNCCWAIYKYSIE